MDELKAYLLSRGADLVGYAALSRISADRRCGMPYGVSIGIALPSSLVKRLPSGEAISEYGEEYDRLNEKLDAICLSAAAYIREKGYRALPQTIAFVSRQRAENKTDSNPGRALLPHKTVAALSGMGWISKSSLLITPEYGSALRLTSLLTEMPLNAVTAEYACRCGDCTLCVDACPGHAIKNRTWDVFADRDDLIDFSKCRTVTLSRGQPYNRTSGTCGICVAVCPFTRTHIE